MMFVVTVLNSVLPSCLQAALVGVQHLIYFNFVLCFDSHVFQGL